MFSGFPWVFLALSVTACIMGSDGFANAVTDGQNSSSSAYVNILTILPYTEGNVAVIDGNGVVRTMVMNRISDLPLLVALAKHGHNGDSLPEGYETELKQGLDSHKEFVEGVLLSVPFYLFDGLPLPTKIEDQQRATTRKKMFDEAITKLGNGEHGSKVKSLLKQCLVRTPAMTRVAMECCQLAGVFALVLKIYILCSRFTCLMLCASKIRNCLVSRYLFFG